MRLQMYLAAANSVAAVNAGEKASGKQKAGLMKKLPAMDARIATALKDSKTLFDDRTHTTPNPYQRQQSR